MYATGKLLRWAVVGTSTLAENFISDLHSSTGSEVLAVVSRDRDRARTLAQSNNVPTGYDLESLLQDSGIDVVYIATPPATHHHIAAAALRAGKHVVVEKPFTLDSSEARNLIAVARQNNLFLMEAMWMTFNPVIRAVRRLVRDGRIGTVRSVRASFGLPFPRDSGSRWKPELGGSALFDQGIYPITFAQMFLGQPTSTTVGGEVTSAGVDATHWMTFEYGQGKFAQVAGSMLEYIDPSAAISGTNGWILIDAPFWTSRSATIHSGDIAAAFTEPERISIPLEGFGYVPMIESISDVISGGGHEHPEHTHEQVLATLDLMRTIQNRLLG